jgi:MarR family transcriptional regulator, temperature-dependent positive regulator of motility
MTGQAQPQERAAPPEGRDAMLDAKLWANPCWFSFRLNYLALRYNGPLYDWIRRDHGLSRPEYVVVYSLALSDGGQARDITATSGFPKNTLSRAIARIEGLGLVERRPLPGGGRSQSLHLTAAGWALFRATLPAFVAHERAMLAALSAEEQQTLSRLMAKMVMAAGDLPDRIEGEETACA